MDSGTSVKFHKRKKRSWFMVLLLVPTVAMLTVTIVIPVFVVISVSFFRYNLLDMNHVRWNNFTDCRAVFTDMELTRAFGRTLVYMCGAVFFRFFIGLGVALLLNSGSLRGGRLFRSPLFLPWTISSLVVAVTWMFIFQPQYDISSYLSQLGDYSVLGSPKAAMMGVIISAVWKQMPLMMIMLLSGLQTMPEDLEEATEIDGATGIRKFWYIMMPYIIPAVKTVTLTSIVSDFQMFVLLLTMTRGSPVRTTTTLPLYTYETTFSGFNLERGAAIGTCWLVFLIIFSTVYNKVLSAKEMRY